MKGKVIEVVLWCECERGSMIKTALKREDGTPVLFWLSKDYLYVRGHCSVCGKVIEHSFPLMELVFATQERGIQ